MNVTSEQPAPKTDDASLYVEQSIKSVEKHNPTNIAATEKSQKCLGSRVSISKANSLIYMQKIEDHFKSTDSYKKLGYTIRDLSTETDIPCYLVSQVINQEYDMNFNELINAYRVQYLARVFKTSSDWQSYTLEAMGRMAGFNSRTAFIAAIKKHTGMTPSAFFGRRESENTEHQIFGNPERMRDVA